MSLQMNIAIRILLPIAIGWPALAQSTVSLRASGPAAFVVTGASNGTPLVVQTYEAHNLQAGDKVVVWGVGATAGGSCVASPANGIRLVKAVVDATHFSITDTAGADIAAIGSWCNGSTVADPSGSAAGGKLTDFTLVAAPRAFLDGPEGTWTRKLALGTHNGLVSFAVAGNVGTATTNYEHGIAVGDTVGIYGSSTPALNGDNFKVTEVTATTFAFATVNVADRTYTGENLTCGPSGDQDCFRISQLAITGNGWWSVIKGLTDNWNSGTSYKHKFDGGSFGVSGGPNGQLRAYGNAAMRAIVDPSNRAMINVAKYCVNRIELFSGVNWSANETQSSGGNQYYTDFASVAVEGAAMCYMTARDYLTPAERRTFADKMYNDVDNLNAAACNTASNLGQRNTLASGVARGGSTTTITLAAADAAANDYYVNNVILATVGGNSSYGLVTAYNGSTKVATVASWSAGAPGAGTAYTIYATITVSSTAVGAATVTGYNTSFTRDFVVGDAVNGSNAWVNTVADALSYITAIHSDTSMTVINSSAITASVSVPKIAWMFSQWKPGSCGLRWLQNHWVGAMGAMPSLYPAGGGALAVDTAGGKPSTYPVSGGNNGYTRVSAWMAMGLVLADDDPRAVVDLAIVQSQWWDWQMRHTWNYSTGLEHSGAGYSWGRVLHDGPTGMITLQKSVPQFPAMDVNNPSGWIGNDVLFRIYDIYPDRRYDFNQSPWPARFGAEVGDNGIHNSSELSTKWQMAAALYFQPTAASTRYYRSFLESFCCVWGKPWDQYSAFGITRVDPRIQPLDFTQQPKQRLFQSTSRDTACVLTGWPCPTTYRGDAAVSNTGWVDRSATHILFQARSYYSDHDGPQAGTIRVYKVGNLLNNDWLPAGDGSQGERRADIVDTMPMFGGATSLINASSTGNVLTSNIIRWAGANHGTWETAYGDGNSRYAYALADLGGAYRTTYNRVYRHFVHLKKPGTEEIILQFDDIDVSNAPTQVETHIHYTQNGEYPADSGGGWREGATTCPGPNGCAGLDMDRIMLSQEDGSTDANNPPRTNGIVSRFFSPNAITLRSDGDAYATGYGHTHRVTVCGGSSCGGAVTKLESVVVHKVTSSLSDTALTAKLLNLDSKWTGVQTLDKVALFARNGASPIMANLQTDHSGVAQYLIVGLQAGFVYRVYRYEDGADVIREGVVDNDNTLYFEATAGTFVIIPEGLSNLILRAGMPTPQVGAPYRYDFHPAGSTGGFRWTVISGSLPRGLSLSQAGLLSGTPREAVSANFTVKAESMSDASLFTTAPLTLQVIAPQLQLEVNAVTSSRAILRYGQAGLAAGERCTLTIGPNADGSSPLETAMDTGGAVRRFYVAGGTAPLEPVTAYFATVQCGLKSAEASFVTAATPQGPVAAQVSTTAPPGLAVAMLEVQYGVSPALGSSVTVACPGACEVSVPLPQGGVAYIRRRYLDSSSRVLAASSIMPIAGTN